MCNEPRPLSSGAIGACCARAFEAAAPKIVNDRATTLAPHPHPEFI
jgi:hypothetical protein